MRDNQDNELSEFLAREQTQGVLEQETGEFHINRLQAMKKLAAFSLPEPGLWLVKIVQAAVAAGADEVRVRLLRHKVKVDFSNPCQWSANKILGHLSGHIPSDARALFHLKAGLLAASEGLKQAMEWSCGGTRVCLSEQDSVGEEAPDDGSFQLVVSRPTRPEVKPDKFNSPIRYLFRKTAHEYKALVDRCRVSPIPIWIDGLKLESQYHTKPWHLPQKSEFKPDAPSGRRKLLAQIPLCGSPDRPPLPYPIDEDPLNLLSSQRTNFSPTYFAPSSTDQPVTGCVCIYSILQKDSRLCYVLDGAIVEQVNLWDAAEEKSLAAELQKALTNGLDDFPLDFYLEVTPNQLDLSHFRVRGTESEPLLRQSLPLLLEAFESLRDHCDLPWEFEFWENKMTPIQNTTWGEVVATAFLSPFVGCLAVYGGVAILAKPLKKLAKPALDARKSRKLRPRLEEVVESLKELLRQGPQNRGSTSG